MHLVIDMGNSLVKTALFENGEICFKKVSPGFTSEILDSILDSKQIDAAIVSSVRGTTDLEALFKAVSFPVLFPDATTPLPIKNQYGSPATLGMDRLAAVTGARALFPEKDLLVINAGTCLTMDFLSEDGVYHGGSIAPGLEMRLRALNQFTGKLPLESPTKENIPLTGNTTSASILSGVINGMIAETDGFIAQYRTQFPELNVILSGGDIFFFDKKLKNRIFAIENIVLYGLNQILEYNV
jgi:type III pantothenate kinase